MSKLQITNPLSQSEYRNFLNQYIKVHYYQPPSSEAQSLESLKNLLFPADFSEEIFTELVDFIKRVMDDLILNGKTLDLIKQELSSEDYSFDDSIITPIESIIQTQRNDILNFINKPFNLGKNEFKKLNWSIKTVLSAKGENFFNEKYADLEFSYASKDNSNIQHKSITFTKSDIQLMMNEFSKIKDNLNKIVAIK